MLPSLSTAGLATGCRFVAIRFPTLYGKGELQDPLLLIDSSDVPLSEDDSGTFAIMNFSEAIVISAI